MHLPSPLQSLIIHRSHFCSHLCSPLHSQNTHPNLLRSHQSGRCFRMITERTYELLPPHSIPEMLRAPLENLVLQVHNNVIIFPHLHIKSHSPSLLLVCTPLCYFIHLDLHFLSLPPSLIHLASFNFIITSSTALLTSTSSLISLLCFFPLSPLPLPLPPLPPLPIPLPLPPIPLPPLSRPLPPLPPYPPLPLSPSPSSSSYISLSHSSHSSHSSLSSTPLTPLTRLTPLTPISPY